MTWRWVAAAAAVVVVVPATLFMGALTVSAELVGGSSGGGASASCGPRGGTPTTVLTSMTVQSQRSTSSVKLSSAQLQNAATIISVGQSLNVPAKGIKVALMVALQESALRNLSNTTVQESLGYPHDGIGSDHDSVNMFQQRPSAGWGSVEQLMQPEYAAKAFFGGPGGPNAGSPRGLLDVADWQQMAPTDAAQAVQVSAAPTAYARWDKASDELMSAGGAGKVSCTTDTVGGAGSWQAPNGNSGQDLVAYAEQFVGKVPYSGACGSAGSPTAGWCCTGFVYYVYHQALGIDLPSAVVSGQLAMATQIPASQAQAGDLVAWVGHHIGIYDGNGGLIHSPDWGRKLEHAKSYNFTIGGTGPTFYRVNALGTGSW
ncbi:C40 family peptidase [Clavibacter nebraskensis]|uniref:C40 family peptidase n=1 Tax=Clavibacter nebraskensis TaxID=31963 RepID=UPI003F4B1615